MRFALLGDHPDGLAMAHALVATGRHELASYAGPVAAAEKLRQQGLDFRSIGDVEEILADPAVELVIVAGSPARRADQLRRALQSERHVLCVHPPDPSPDLAYEAAMIQADVKHLLFPLLPDALHPAIARLHDILRNPDPAVGDVTLIEIERATTGPLSLQPGEIKPNLPGWDVLRRLGGEIAEVSAYAEAEEINDERPLILTGRFERGGMFLVKFLPWQPEGALRLKLMGSRGRAELSFASGVAGAVRLTRPGDDGGSLEEVWDAWNPWPDLVTVLERALLAGETVRPGWQDAIRCLELDDAARRSVEKRRSSGMEYQEASEEVGFKGTMTLVGCGLLWGILGLLILSAWFPKVGWLIIPGLALFLVLQLFRWIIPAARPSDPAKRKEGEELKIEN